MPWEWFVKTVTCNTFSMLHYCDLHLLLHVWLTDHPTFKLQFQKREAYTRRMHQPLNYCLKAHNHFTQTTVCSSVHMWHSFSHVIENFQHRVKTLTLCGELKKCFHASNEWQIHALGLFLVRVRIVKVNTHNHPNSQTYAFIMLSWRLQFSEIKAWNVKN